MAEEVYDGSVFFLELLVHSIVVMAYVLHALCSHLNEYYSTTILLQMSTLSNTVAPDLLCLYTNSSAEP